MGYAVADAAGDIQFNRFRHLYLWSDAVAPYVDEYLFAVGCAQFLAGRIGVPHDGYGRLVAGDHLALPPATLLYALSDHGVQWLSARRCVVPPGGHVGFHADTVVCA